MDKRWEYFSINTVPTPGSITELLDQVESQGYEPKFLKYNSNNISVFGRKKDLPQLEFKFDQEEVHELTPPEKPLNIAWEDQ